MRIPLLTGFLALVLFCSGTRVFAEGDVDPLARNLVFVEGEAEVLVPVDGFSLTMGFDVDRASFGDAGAVSDEIAFRMEREIKSLGLQNVEVIKGWDIVKQKMIAFGEKGRKVSNKLVVRVYDCPLEKLHRVIADAMDKCLAVDKSVIIEEISVILKDEVENEKKQEASIRAVAAMDKNASRVAETLGKKISAPKRIFFSNDKQALQSRNDFMGYGEDCRSKQNYAVEAELSRSVVSIQKSFKVKSEIVDHIKIKSRVSGIYEIE